jgi:hypothetical protein
MVAHVAYLFVLCARLNSSERGQHSSSGGSARNVPPCDRNRRRGRGIHVRVIRLVGAHAESTRMNSGSRARISTKERRNRSGTVFQVSSPDRMAQSHRLGHRARGQVLRSPGSCSS